MWQTIRCGLQRSDEGSATAEFAITLPAVVMVIAVLLACACAVSVSMTCQEAASNVAHALLADERADVVGIAQQSMAQASVSVASVGSGVEVVTSCPLITDSLNVLPAQVHGRAVAYADE